MSNASWEEYLDQFEQSSAACFPKANLLRRLQDRSRKVFSQTDAICVRVSDFRSTDAGTQVSSNIYDTEGSYSRVLEQTNTDNLRCRIISVYSDHSISPLLVTSTLMSKILQKHHVHPSFIQVLLSFGEVPHGAEAGTSYSFMDVSCESPTAYYTNYQINYAEENFRKLNNPWSLRHTGVYHQHTPVFDLFILLHPNRSSLLDARLLQYLGLQSASSPYTPTAISNIPRFIQDPASLHTFVLSSYLENWRWYLRHLGGSFEKCNDDALTTTPEEATSKKSFDQVATLRNLNDWVYQAQASCSGTLDLVKMLEQAPGVPNGRYTGFKTMLHGYIDSCEALLPRIRNAIDLVGYTLTLHNELESARVEVELRDLTFNLQEATNQLKHLQQDNVDDSATVKIITFVSAIYLPGSFVVSLYSMDFFSFDQASKHIVIATDFWVFLATWLPLTVLTGIVFVLIVLFDSWWKGRPFHMFKRPARQDKEKVQQSAEKESSGDTHLVYQNKFG